LTGVKLTTATFDVTILDGISSVTVNAVAETESKNVLELL
jgi:hypothetical protein